MEPCSWQREMWTVTGGTDSTRLRPPEERESTAVLVPRPVHSDEIEIVDSVHIKAPKYDFF